MTTSIYSLSVKLNAEFGQRQGNSLEDTDVTSLWNELFLYNEAESSRGTSTSQKNETRRVFCDIFMVSQGMN